MHLQYYRLYIWDFADDPILLKKDIKYIKFLPNYRFQHDVQDIHKVFQISDIQ